MARKGYIIGEYDMVVDNGDGTAVAVFEIDDEDVRATANLLGLELIEVHRFFPSFDDPDDLVGHVDEFEEINVHHVA